MNTVHYRYCILDQMNKPISSFTSVVSALWTAVLMMACMMQEVEGFTTSAFVLPHHDAHHGVLVGISRSSSPCSGAGVVGGSDHHHRSHLVIPVPSTSTRTHKNTHLLRSSSSSQNNHDDINNTSNDDVMVNGNRPSGLGGTYRRFAEYAWNKLVLNDEVLDEQQQQSLFLSETVKPVPTDLQYNSTPARGMPDGSQVKIELKSASASSPEGSPIRLARYALLETLTPSLVGVDDNVDDDNDDTSSVDNVAQQQSDMDVMNKSAPMISIPQAIHVLNLVVFPKTSLSLPVLGMDLVTLPGGKHLIAIDFQPVLPPPIPTSASSSSSNDNNINNMDNEHVNDTVPTCGILFGPKFQKYETQLKELHQKFVLEERHVMPWGGDIPPQALRFFSPYALWTRLQDGKTEDGGKGSALEIIDHQVYQAFCAYLDLYLDMMQEVQEDLGQGNIQDGDAEDGAAIRQGHVDYLNYRKANDPARPMLTRLYGEEYTEKAISEVLFEMI
eukprot:scaffold10173_cov281-Chaetoceros_neogracile.AAC.3